MKYTQDYYLLLLKSLDKYLRTKEAIHKGFTAFDFTSTLEAYRRYEDFYKKVVKQPIYSNELTENLFKSLHEYLAPIYTLTENVKKYSDIDYIDAQQIDRLLQSFGCKRYGCLTYRQRKLLLLRIVDLYRHKGTHYSADSILKLFADTYSIHEVFYKKHNSPYDFVYYSNIKGIPGVSYTREDTVDKSHILDDPRWFITDSELKEWPVNKAVTPHLVITNDIHTTDNLAAITILRTFATNNYNVLQKYGKDSEEYNNTKLVRMDLLPQDINYLELYYFTQYLYNIYHGLQKERGIVHDRTYGYSPPNVQSDIVINEMDRQFNNRFSTPNEEIVSKTTVRTWKEDIQTLYLSKIPNESILQTIDINLTEFTYTVVRNKLIIVGGIKDDGSYNNRIIIVNIDDPSISTVIEDFPKQCLNPIVIPDEHTNKILVTGGKTLDGYNDLSSYIVDLSTYDITRVTDLQPEWNFNKPIVVSNDQYSLVISKDYKDKYNGFIYKWSVGNQIKQLVAALDPDYYDISTLKAIASNDNIFYLLVKSTKFNAYRILYLNINDSILADITCIILTQIDDLKIRDELTNHILDGSFDVLPLGKNILITYQTKDDELQCITISHKSIKGERFNYIQPKSISPFLLPLRSNYIKLDDNCDKSAICFKDDINSINATYELDEKFKTIITNVNRVHKKTFISVKFEDERYEIDYWPAYLHVFFYKSQQHPSIEVNIPFRIEDLTYDDAYFSDMESYSQKYGFPQYFLVDFDRLRQVIGSQQVSYTSFLYSLPQHSNYANIFKEYDVHFKYNKQINTQHTPFYKLSDTYRNNYYCYYVYSTTYMYDLKCKFSLVSYTSLPLDQKELQYLHHPMYTVKSLPSKITVEFTAAYYHISKRYLKTIDYSKFTNYINYFIGLDDNKFYIYKTYPYVNKRMLDDFNLTFDANNSLYGKKQNILKDRVNKIEQGNIPQFDKFEDLANFLDELSPTNKMYIDGLDKQNRDLVFSELISYINGLYKNANLYSMAPHLIENCMETLTLTFTPIHSRLLPINTRMLIHDPVGDFIGLGDSFEYFNLKKLIDNLTVFDSYKYKVTKQLFEYIMSSDYRYDKELNYNQMTANVHDEVKAKAVHKQTETIHTEDQMKLHINKQHSDNIHINDKVLMIKRNYLFDNNVEFDRSPIPTIMDITYSGGIHYNESPINELGRNQLAVINSSEDIYDNQHNYNK